MSGYAPPESHPKTEGGSGYRRAERPSSRAALRWTALLALAAGFPLLLPAENLLAFRFPMGGAAVAGPAAAGGRIWVVSEDRTLYIIDDAGRTVGRRFWRDRNPDWIAPDQFGRAIIPDTGGSLVMVNQAGLEVYRVRPGWPVPRAPAFGADGRFFVATGTRMAAYSAAGRLLWSVDHPVGIALGPWVRPASVGTRVVLALRDGRVLEYGESGHLLSSHRCLYPPSAWASLGDGMLMIYRDGSVSGRDGQGTELFRALLPAPPVAAAGDGAEAWVLLEGGRAVRVGPDGAVSAPTETGAADARELRVFPQRILALGPRSVASLARDGQVYRNLYLSHAPRMPAASVSGLVFSAGEDWILYAYRFETNLGEPPAPAIGFMDLESAGRRADEEALWNPDFRSEEGVLRELRRIEKSILSYSIGTDEPDVLALCSAIVLGWGAHAPGPLPSGPRPPGVRPRALACDILGLLGSPRAVPILIEAYLRDPYPFVRAAAARALGAIGLDVAGEAMRAFRAAAELEYFLDERGAFATIEGVEGIYRAMGNLSDPDGVRAVMRIAGRPFGSAVRSSAQAALRRLFEPARREE